MFYNGAAHTMTTPPESPKIYHITHVDNLASIVKDGGLVSDAIVSQRGGPATTIGMSHIKGARFHRPVACHAGDVVADYVPFNFCPRSVMLYLIYRANHPQLAYRGGQGPILHLEADLHRTVEWANANGVRWAFTASNASAAYAEFYSTLNELILVPWEKVADNGWQEPAVKEAKQAEFLLFERMPWTLVEAIGVRSQAIKVQAEAAVAASAHRPSVILQPAWYY